MFAKNVMTGEVGYVTHMPDGHVRFVTSTRVVEYSPSDAEAVFEFVAEPEIKMSPKEIAKRNILRGIERIKTDPVNLIVEALLYDLSDRRGIKRELEALDDDVLEELKETWRETIREALK